MTPEEVMRRCRELQWHTFVSGVLLGLMIGCLVTLLLTSAL